MRKRILTLIILIIGLSAVALYNCTPAEAAEDLVIVGPGGHAQLDEAVAAVNDGGSIEVKAGQYTVSHLSINKNLTIYSTEGAILIPAADTASSGASASWIRVESGCQVELNGLTLDGSGKKIYNALYGAGTLLVYNCTFNGFTYPLNKGRAIVLIGDNSVVDGCSFTQIGRTGMYLYSSQNILLQNNTYTGKGIGNYLDYGIEATGGAQVTIRSNTINGCRGLLTSTGTYSAAILISTENTSIPSSALVENNVIRENLYGVLIGAMGNDNSQVQMTNNIIADNQSSAVFSYSREISAENNYWGVNGPVLQGANALPDWLDICPWAADTTDENGDGVFDQLAYLLNLQWTTGGTELELTGVEPGSTCSLSFSVRLDETAPETGVSYILEWTATDPNTFDGLTVNDAPLQNNVYTITDTLQPGEQITYDVNVTVNTPGTYTVSLYGVRL